MLAQASIHGSASDRKVFEIAPAPGWMLACASMTK
jgi:hypothetical protein